MLHVKLALPDSMPMAGVVGQPSAFVLRVKLRAALACTCRVRVREPMGTENVLLALRGSSS